MAFLGANDFFLLEKESGRVLRVTNGVVAGTVLDLAVNSASERGLLGIALHPNFSNNGFAYLYWTESSTGVDTTAIESVPLLGNRVDRFVWNGSTLAFNQTLIRLRAFQADAGQPLRGNHNGGVLRFGPDGKLYIVDGDNGRRGLLQNITSGGPVPDDQFGGPEPDDAHLTGVILRLNDDGSTPTDNPFFNATTGLTGQAAANVKKVFAYGLRNSFGMDFDPVGGFLWTQENGDDAFDEINRVEAGFNGGWIQTMGPSSRVAQFKQIETSRAGGLQQVRWPPSNLADTPAQALSRLFALPGSTYTEPAFSWKYAVAPSPIGFARGGGLGALYANDLFVGASRTTLLGGYLFRFNLSNDRKSIAADDPRLSDLVADNADKFDLAESESLLVGRDFGITTDIQTAPNGNLYVVSLSKGAIYEIFSQPTLFVASLNGQQEIPPTGSPAKGTATILLNTEETSARVSLNFSGLTTPQTVAHIHGPATATQSAPPIFDLPAGNFTDYQISLTPQQINDLKDGLFYVNVHSMMFPAGEIRGQFNVAAAPALALLNVTNTNVSESANTKAVNVTRMGDTSVPVTVDYATSDGTATDRKDYTTARGTLRFAAGETSKSFEVLITDDAFVEGDETFNVTLSNPTGAVLPSAGNTAVITISDNDAPGTSNPIDDSTFFVRQHYHDFLNRDPEAAGLQFWRDQIEVCGADAQCREVRRINVSAAFFLSIEFQETGYFAYRLYEASFDRQPRYLEFIPDTQELGRDVIVGVGNWQQQLETNRQAFADRWVQRSSFRATFDLLPNGSYVDRLFANAGVAPSPAERDALVNGLNVGTETRATVLRKVVDNAQFRSQEFSRAFVLMQYFGYLRRNPDDPPDTNFDGYNFWLTKLNQFNGDFIRAEMVKAFIASIEYRARFGQ
jgi:glucose/arabinose dehydrogenase